MKLLKVILTFVTMVPICVLSQCYTYTISTTPPSCSSCCDGKISITNLLGGCPPYSTTWSDGNISNNDISICYGITYTLTIKDASSCCPDSIVLLQTPNSTTSINEDIVNAFFLSLYPNPSNEEVVKLNFKAPTNKDVKIVVCDMTGRIVLLNTLHSQNEVNNNYTLDITNLSKGMYIINLIIDKIKVGQKFIKQ